MEHSMIVYAEWVFEFAAALVSWGIWRLYQLGRRPSDLPPGPPTSPFVGNMLIMPKKSVFLQMTAWARQYGEIFSLVGGYGGTTVVLTSPRAIHEVLERQAHATSDRAQTVINNTIFGGLSIGSSNYNAYWKATRRAAMEVLKPSACAHHVELQTAETRQLLFDILHSPEETFKHVQRLTISTMLSVIYGQRTPRFASPLISEWFELTRRNFEVLGLGAARALQMFPVLQYMPERWASWKTPCRAVRRDMRTTLLGLFDATQQRVARGQANGCHMETVMEMGKDLGLGREELCYFGWSMIGGGTTTSATWIHFFILCMAAHPHIQAKAQKEIHNAIGNDRAPVLSDIDNLPYLQAIIKEVSRFRPALTMIVPHVATADVMYNGYRIPSGSVILGNIWGVFQDEKLFEHPDEFDPERFVASPFGLRKDVQLDHEEAFRRLNTLPWGSGRRICPGIHLAQQTLAINAMNLLWAFNFDKARNPDGSEIPIDLWGFRSTATVDVLPFVVDAKARSTSHEELIEKEFLTAADVFEQFERELGPEDLQYVRDVRSGIINDSQQPNGLPIAH